MLCGKIEANQQAPYQHLVRHWSNFGAEEISASYKAKPDK